jgi:hypothetical protein
VAKHPRFNHVAMSMPADALGADGRAAIVAFCNEVFGWTEIPQLTKDRAQLVLQVYSFNQFVFLIAEDTPMQAPRMDHFGIQVETMDELDDMLARARAYKDKDDRVDIVDKSAEDYGMLVLTSFYVRHLLPMMVEVQHYQLVSPSEETTAVS